MHTECFRMHAECSRMFQNACRIFQNVTECMQNVQECSECLQKVPECYRTHAECSRMFQNVPECMQNIPECSRMHANNDNDNDQAYDLADTSYVNEDISVHNAPDSDNIPTKLNDFFSDIDTRKEKLKQNYRGDEAIQRAVATLHQKIKKQNNGNIETFKRSVICLKWDTKHQFKLAKAEKGRMVGLFPIPVLVCYHTQDPESFFTEETELQLSDEDSMNLTY